MPLSGFRAALRREERTLDPGPHTPSEAQVHQVIRPGAVRHGVPVPPALVLISEGLLERLPPPPIHNTTRDLADKTTAACYIISPTLCRLGENEAKDLQLGQLPCPHTLSRLFSLY